MLLFVFWISIFVLFYAYAGFPLTVWAVGRLLNRKVRKEPHSPRVSLIIAAYNEELSIAQRLDNALETAYPADRLEIIVASDGSNDSTEAIVESYAPRVALLSLPRRGKIHALNAAVKTASGEVLVFTDANIHFHSQALSALTRNFADPQVGAVAGNKVYRVDRDSESSGRGEKLYWNYDKWLKSMETATGSTVSADGAIYAIRKSLYPSLEDSAVTDDFAISTSAVDRGYRLVFEAEAIAYEDVIPAADREFRRKVRLMTRGLRSVLLRRGLLNPFRSGFYALTLFSHKLLRRLVPFVLLILLAVSSLGALGHPLLMAALAGQVSFYSLAVLGCLLRRSSLGGKKWLMIPFFYCLANLSALLAVLKVLSGQRIERWNPQRHLAQPELETRPLKESQ